ncbi:MAG: hypothetical protein ACI91O_001684 [Candidatus Poriferisodalaceae bacterium]|jgi:hypothetical protein
MGLKGFERRLERLVEGAFARAFRSGLRPIELGRRVGRALDDERSVDVRGRTVVPNHLTFQLADDDYARLAQISEGLQRELAEVAREHARDRGYHFLGPVGVELAVRVGERTGRFRLVGAYREHPAGVPPGTLILEDGQRIVLGPEPVVIGRFGECDVVIDDPNISRRHAQISLDHDTFVIADLGSTNGMRVNGHHVSRHELSHGDVVLVGAHTMTFEVG